MEAAATEVAVEVAAMVVVDVEVAGMAGTVDMVVDAEVVAAMVVDRAAMTRVAMAVDREVMGVVATKTSPPKLCTVQMLNIKYSPCVLSLLSNNFHI